MPSDISKAAGEPEICILTGARRAPVSTSRPRLLSVVPLFAVGVPHPSVCLRHLDGARFSSPRSHQHPPHFYPPACCSPLLAIPETSRSLSAWLLASAAMVWGGGWDQRPLAVCMQISLVLIKSQLHTSLTPLVKAQTETRLSGEAKVLRVE